MSEDLLPGTVPTVATTEQLLVFTRQRKSYLKKKYAEAITIREIDPITRQKRRTQIPATLQSGRARMLIIATKLMDRMERRLDIMTDADAQMSTKEYKEFTEGIARVDELMMKAFAPERMTPAPQIPVNNGIIINAGAANADIAQLLSRVTAKARAAPMKKVEPAPNDIRGDQADNNGNRNQDGPGDD